ncbi:MAG: dolichyl-diphosphooligosaccharide--protein glycosyltransferase subunit STT3, partial [Methanobacterium sp.]|nr:dolichyl-diphosphooligosaccharide--protein glycosyltransferase subunit STT3 [Methanobacterium sp.]
PLIVYLSSFIYYLINLFAKIPLISIVFWISAFIAPLSGIIAYFLVKKFTNDFGALASGIFIVTTPMYVFRTLAGWFDTDMFNIFFPLLVTWLFFEAVDKRNNQWKGGIFAFAAAFSIYIFSLAWNGWQFIFYFIVLFSIIYIIWCKFKGRRVKNLIFVFLTFLLGSLLLIGILNGYINIFKLFAGPFEVVKITGNPWAPWPDVYSTVSELSNTTMLDIISSLGITFLAGLFGYIWIFRVMMSNKYKNIFLNRMNWFFYNYLLLWAIVGLVTLIKGPRFIMMLIPPISISAGIFIGIIVEYLTMLRTQKRFEIFQKRKNLVNLISILIILWVTFLSVLSLNQSISTLKPMANDDMWSASDWINNYTSNDTVIISQWTYGHLFTAIADRPVVFDGRLGYIETLPSRSYGNAYPYGDKSPAIYREYWIDKAFSTNNESLSVGIFRMLTTSGDLAYLTLNNYTNNTTESVEILNNILGLDNKSAKQLLLNKYQMNQEQANDVLKYTHPNNPKPFVLVTTNGMLNLGQTVFMYGEWDFNTNRGNNYNYSINEFKLNNGILKTNDGLLMDIASGRLTWKNKTPNLIITIKDGKMEKRVLDNNSSFNVILLMDEKKAIVMDKRFENSLFAKLLIEKTNSTDLEIIYRYNNVLVWKSKN